MQHNNNDNPFAVCIGIFLLLAAFAVIMCLSGM